MYKNPTPIVTVTIIQLLLDVGYDVKSYSLIAFSYYERCLCAPLSYVNLPRLPVTLCFLHIILILLNDRLQILF